MGFVLDIWSDFGVFVMLAMSLNFLVGYAGIMYVGHIAFFAFGAYSTAILCQHYDWFPPAAMLFGILLSGVSAVVLGMLTLRLAGHYLLLASLGVCEIVRSLINNSSFSGGAEGILVPRDFIPVVSGGQYGISVLIAIFLSLEIFFFDRLIQSPKGKLYRAIRDDALLVVSVGRSVSRLRIQALVISSMWASIAGSLYAHWARYIDPTSFTIMDSLMLLIAVMVGGISSTLGSVAAGVIMIIVPAITRFVNVPPTVVGPVHQIVFALVLLVILARRPKGLFGKVALP